MPLVWASRSFSFPALHKIQRTCTPLYISQLLQELQGLDLARLGLNFHIPRNKVPLPLTGSNAVSQSQVNARAQAAPAGEAAQRDTEKGSTETSPLPSSLPVSRCPYGSPAFPQLCRHPPVTVICDLSLYAQNKFGVHSPNFKAFSLPQPPHLPCIYTSLCTACFLPPSLFGQAINLFLSLRVS